MGIIDFGARIFGFCARRYGQLLSRISDAFKLNQLTSPGVCLKKSGKLIVLRLLCSVEILINFFKNKFGQTMINSALAR